MASRRQFDSTDVGAAVVAVAGAAVGLGVGAADVGAGVAGAGVGAAVGGGKSTTYSGDARYIFMAATHCAAFP